MVLVSFLMLYVASFVYFLLQMGSSALKLTYVRTPLNNASAVIGRLFLGVRYMSSMFNFVVIFQHTLLSPE